VTVGSAERVIGAVDWGGTWIRVALVANGRIVHRERIRRPDSLPDQYAAVATLVQRGAAAVGQPPAAVGVGVAGVVQHGQVMTAINLGITTATDVVGALQGELACPVFLVNDVQAAASSLAIRWPDDLTAVITMGTGIGGAVIEHGRLLTGNGAAGDFGHTVVQVDGPRCPCGGAGCLEALVSGRVLAGAADDLVAWGRSEFLANVRLSGRALHAGDLQDAAQAGDAQAREVLERGAAAFAAGLRTIVAALDPARIVVAGSLLAEDAAFGGLVRQRWDDIRPAWCTTPLVHVADDEDAALLGAANFAAGELETDLQ
jgi:predicted NBD/HSP70 family sugar kinase